MKSKLCYETLKFEDNKDSIRVLLLRYFYFEFPRDELDFEITVKDGILYSDVPQAKLENKFNQILTKGLSALKNSLTGKSAVYLHRNSGMPLIGHNAFGIVDRNTSLIEIKPITGCNLSCIFCSVDEGKDSKKVADYVIEKDYLVQELIKRVKFKEISDIEINIGTNGEPLLYAEILPLIEDIHRIKEVKVISINTNGTFLTKSLIDELVKAGLTQLNLSLNAIDPAIAQKLAGNSYNLQHVLEMAKYAASVKGLSMIIAPVWIPGLNDTEIPKLIEFGKRIGAKYVAIQNFLNYPHGRNPVKQKSWDKFYDELRLMEKSSGQRLIFDAADFGIHHTKKLPVPFKKDDTLKLILSQLGRYPNEKLAFARDRIISVITYSKLGAKVTAKIVRTKHNIIIAKT